MYDIDKFNFNVSPITEYVPYEKTVNIHLAPTDESLKLLKEMHESVVDNIITSVKLNENNFEAFGLVHFQNISNYVYGIRFKLNKKEYLFKGELPVHEMVTTYNVKSELIKKIYEHLASEIAKDFILNSDLLKTDNLNYR